MILYACDGEIGREELLAQIDADLFERGQEPLSPIGYSDRGAPIGRHHFVSITHTGTKIVIAVSSSPVGVDIERNDRKLALRGADVAAWTAYEATAKLRGDGIRLSEVRDGVPKCEARYFDIFCDHTTAVAGGDPSCTVVYLPKR